MTKELTMMEALKRGKRITEFEDALNDAEHAMREYWNMADVESDAEKAAQSILNKLSNVRKAFVHEFGGKD